MAAEEGVEDRGLVPPRHELGRRVVEEAADVGADEDVVGQRQRQQHGQRLLEVAPQRHVVARPHGRVALRPAEEGPRQDEGPALHVRRDRVAQDVAVVRRHRVVVAVHVVHRAVRERAAARGAVHGLLVHRDLVRVEDARLVHVDPRVQVRRRPRVAVVVEQRRVPAARVGVVEVDPAALARPAVALEVGAALGLHVHALLAGLAVHVVVVVALDVRVRDRDHLATAARDGLDHLLRVREVVLVPREVALAVGVLDVEP